MLFAAFNPKMSQLFRSSPLKYFKNDNLWRRLAPFLREIKICIHRVFCRKLNSEQFFFEAFSDIFSIFVAFSPKVNLLSHSSASKYFLNGNLWRLLAPLRREGDRDMRPLSFL